MGKEEENPELELMSSDWAKVFIDEARSVIFFDTEGRSDMAETSVDNGKTIELASWWYLLSSF